MGFNERDVLEMPIDKLQLYTAAAVRYIGTVRGSTVLDTSAAIGFVFSGGKGTKDYLALLQGDTDGK